MAGELWTIGSILKWTEQYFREKGVESPRLDAEVLLSSALKKERIYLYIHFDQPLVAEELAVFREMVKKRAMRMPVAYITGVREFWGRSFCVTKDVLIPRPDTEILVEAVLSRLKKCEVRVADIGTGSGAIAVTVALEHELAKVEAVDISREALLIAEKNSKLLGAGVTFLQGDLLAPLSGRYDAIISNPPYITGDEMKQLMVDVSDYEPHLALFGGEDGLDFYRRLVLGIDLLTEDGFLALEIGSLEAEDVKTLAEKAGFCRVEVLKDYAGLNRVVIAWKN